MKLTSSPVVAPQVSLRWLTIACFELRIGDFSIVIDPCIGYSPRADFGAEVIQRADLILLSHGHWDHITDLKALCERFNCPILAGELTAPSLIRVLDVNPIMVYPVTPNLELDFGGARVRALFARHTNQRKPLSQLKNSALGQAWNDTPEKQDLDFYGSMEYRDYLITTPSGMKIMFWGSNATPEQFAIMREIRPDVALMQYTKQQPEDLVALAQAGGVKVLIPHHMDLAQAEEEYLPRIDALEALMRDRCPACTVIHPERLQWLRFGMGMCAD